MTSLRRRMTEDMQVRNLSLQTQATYMQQVSMFAHAAGLRVSEAICLKVTDIDRERMLIRVQQGKGAKCCQYVFSVGHAARRPGPAGP